MQKASTVAETFDFFLTNAPTPQNKPARTLKVRAGLLPNTKRAILYPELYVPTKVNNHNKRQFIALLFVLQTK